MAILSEEGEAGVSEGARERQAETGKPATLMIFGSFASLRF